jgi:CheY-like chemotaxis protein
MSDYLPSLKNSIKTGKIGQAKKLLSHIREKLPQEKEQILEMVALAPDKTAHELLFFLTSKAHKDPQIQDRLIQLVTDRAHLNYRFVLILFQNAERSTVIHATPLLKHILSNETDKELLSDVIRASGKLKINGMVAVLAEFIFYDDLKLKTDAVNALERIGSPLALEKLKQAARTEKCDQNILDTIQVLEQHQEQQEKTPAKSASPKTEDTPDLSRLADPSFRKRFETLNHFCEHPVNFSDAFSKPEAGADYNLTLNLLRLVARTIPVDAINPLFNIISGEKNDPNIKFMAYTALAAYPELESAASVLRGMNESAMHVRLAAIKVLDRNVTDFVIAEIKNRIETGTKKGEILAHTILDAKARNIIQALMISDTFSFIASNYLSKTAPIPILDTFIDILKSRNLSATAKKYQDIKNRRQETGQESFIVISSSETILNMYCKLIYSCGFPCQPFRQAQDAFETIVFEKPKAIICDLFLNDLTGMDFCREVRDIYTKEQVPVIISTLQRDLDSREMDSEIQSAGVNALCEFPPNTSQIKSWVK